MDLVLHLMGWKRIRHVPVENEQGRLVGMVSWYHLVRLLRSRDAPGEPTSVTDIMQPELSTVTPETPLNAALRLMKQSGVDSLLVVTNDRLVGIVTERDIIRIAHRFVGKE